MEQQQNKPDKLTDKAFSRLMLISILSILICITCLCSATWAWFGADSSVDGNTVSSGQFDLEISVTNANGETVTLAKNAVGQTVYTFESAGVYVITLCTTKDTTVTKGFCTMNVSSNTYYTDSIFAEAAPFTFTVDVKADGTTVTFSPAWGIPSAKDLVEQDGTLMLEGPSHTE